MAFGRMTTEEWREICRGAAKAGLTKKPIWREACRMRGKGAWPSEVRRFLGIN